MMFTDLTAAFEEMEFLVKTTNRTHRVVHGSRRTKYRVVEASIAPDTAHFIAQLNVKNFKHEGNRV